MEQTRKAALPSTLRQKNYLAILNAFRDKKALSANEVSEHTGISRATVMKAVSLFIQKGLLESAGKGSSTEIGGKKPELFRFCMKRYLICVGLWSSEMVVSLFDLSDELLNQKTVHYTRKESVEEFMNLISRTAEELLVSVEDGRELLYGISLCMGGFLDDETGTLKYSILTPEWGEKIPVKELLEQRFPGAEVVVDNVARMSACAAVLDNPEYEQKRVASIYSDVGVSACYIDKGHVKHGKNALVGEIGLMAMALPYMEPYTKGEEALFYSLISEKTICSEIRQEGKLFSESLLYKKKDELQLTDVFEAAEAGDELARALVRKKAWIFGAAIHNIMVNFDPETIIIQGSFADAGSWFEKCVREAMGYFSRLTSAPVPEIKYDTRSLISLQMTGMTKVLTRKFFSSTDWL